MHRLAGWQSKLVGVLLLVRQDQAALLCGDKLVGVRPSLEAWSKDGEQ